jgi:hypothetical protein
VPGGGPDRGREYQGAIWEGNTHLGVCVDLINPTHAAGDWGRRHVVWEIRERGANYLGGTVTPHDYCGRAATTPYRSEHLRGRWPATGWTLTFRYTLEGNRIRYETDWSHADDAPRYVDHYTHALHLWHRWFQRPMVNEGKRVWGSHRDDLIADSRVAVEGAGVRVRFEGSPGTLHSYAPDLRGDVRRQAEPGKATFLEQSLQAHIRRLVAAGETLRMVSTTTVEARR